MHFFLLISAMWSVLTYDAPSMPTMDICYWPCAPGMPCDDDGDNDEDDDEHKHVNEEVSP